ncbi:succinyl-diaminopimelate desuccinylase [Sphingomonas humi]|uniref:Succinyl-diaminopimelate desuccinylase n=1 Tax=Sphingomonas humi TaxID=335630 RepID=A0ABP7S3F1_9SPHN
MFDVLDEALSSLGFTIHRFTLGEAPDGPTENMVAIRERGPGPHVGFAGHLDVVPPGEGWEGDAFTARVVDGRLIGRGANDMKSAIAAAVGAVSMFEQQAGTLSFLITGDEEGYATFGTPRIIDWLTERAIRPDMILIGEPTSETQLGDTVKIGRRGSLNFWLKAKGVQGHVAYPHKADNPVPRLARVVAALSALHLDDGTEVFPPSNLEFVALGTPTAASNVIPGEASAQGNIRFNNLHSGEQLIALLSETVAAIDPACELRTRISGEAFLTPPGRLYDLVTQAIRAECGIEPHLSTGGGTSDGRFLIKLCPVVDFGLPNATMHKVHESAATGDIETLARVYRHVFEGGLSA